MTEYTDRITARHASKPKFMAVVRAMTDGAAQSRDAALAVIDAYRLRDATGIRLDRIGEWVGITRFVEQPIAGVYFAFDVYGVGFDEGVWKGEFDPDEGLTGLDDEAYRTLLKAKIAANHWDGTLPGAVAVLSTLFDVAAAPQDITDTSGALLTDNDGNVLLDAPAGTMLFLQDNQDMSMTVAIAGQLPNQLILSLVTNGYLPLKPMTVHANYAITSVDGTPIFGFDCENEYVSGFDVGSWATTYDKTVVPTPTPVVTMHDATYD